jgi:two-component system response regulator MprA
VRILVVDDDEAVRRSLAHALRRDGYQVLLAADGTEAMAELGRARPEVIVLDVLVPEPNGLEICRRLRRRGDQVPILMLTARDLVEDRVAGLDAGADDYLVKPFALDELRARLRALLRRTGVSLEVLRFADVVMDTATCRVTRRDRQIVLTRTEYALLELFLRNPDRVLSRTAIFESVWGYDLIQTVRGLGYVLREHP